MYQNSGIQIQFALKQLFHSGSFKQYADKLCVPLQKVPSACHSKNAIDSRQTTFKFVFIRFKNDSGTDYDPYSMHTKTFTVMI